MKKIRLEIDALRVSSFATAAASGAHGTVRGLQIDPFNEAAGHSSCIPDVCPCGELTLAAAEPGAAGGVA
jgi:hypothetical protein